MTPPRIVVDSNVVVSGDSHLLDLREWGSIVIVPPADFMKALGERNENPQHADAGRRILGGGPLAFGQEDAVHRKSLLLVLGLLAAVWATTAPACRIPVIVPWPPMPGPPHPPHPPPPPPALEPMLTKLHQAEIRVEDQAASVEVTATFFNPNNMRVEGTYFFPIEADAVVRGFSMTVNGKELQADLLPADQARKTYEEIVRKLKDPGLLEYAGTRMLKARIFPIEPRSDVKIALRYTQVAQADGGVYHLRYPLRSAQPNAGQVDQLAVRVAVKASKPVKLFYCPTHKLDVVRKGESEVTGGFELRGGLPDRDVDVYWSVDAGDVGVGVSAFKPPDEDGYCLIALSPRLQAADREVQPKDVVFAFDRSGSMDGEKIRQARSALRYCLGHLRREDRFGLIAYGSAVDVLTPGLVEATTDAVERARGQVETLDARGGTALHDALLKSFDLLGREPRLPMVVFLTDGRPTIGPADLDEVLSAARKANAARARLFAFGVGYDLNTDLLDRLATENGGTQQYVAEGEDIEVKVSGFYDKISQPVLAGVTVEAKGVELRDLYPRQPPDLFASGQVLLFGRYRGSGRHDVVVRGKVRDREQVFETTANFDGSAANAFVPAVWAQRKVAFLLEQIRLHGREKELEEEVVSLGKRYGILTPYTSFLVVDDRAPQPLREVAAASRRSFEFEKDGRTAFYQSRGVAAAKAADAMAAPGAPLVLGMGGEGNGDIYGVGVGHGVAGAASPLVRQAVERVRRAGGKTFYLQDDGCYYDSTFAEAQRPRIEEIEPLSDAWFALLDRHPGIGVYLAARFPMVLCMEGRVYRIRNV